MHAIYSILYNITLQLYYLMQFSAMNKHINLLISNYNMYFVRAYYFSFTQAMSDNKVANMYIALCEVNWN